MVLSLLDSNRSDSEMDIARDMEVFGPVFPVITFETMEEAIEIANNSIFGLSLRVITEDMQGYEGSKQCAVRCLHN